MIVKSERILQLRNSLVLFAFTSAKKYWNEILEKILERKTRKKYCKEILERILYEKVKVKVPPVAFSSD